MKAMTALIWREFLEHRGAFFYAPAALLAVLFGLVLLMLGFGRSSYISNLNDTIAGTQMYQMALGAGFGMWMAYLLVALFFYYADSFSADRRNNSLLFWKSMPQSDFKVLGAKALAGITLFPALVLGFFMVTGVLIYLLSFIAAIKLPVPLIGPVEMLGSWLMMGLAGLVGIGLTIIWYAPFLAWVAGLSTLVQRWSIPLAFLVPAIVTLVERITTIGQPDSARPIAAYLSYRGKGVLDDVDVVDRILHGGITAPLGLIGDMFSHYDWSQAALGVLIALGLVYLASEYRRRRIEA